MFRYKLHTLLILLAVGPPMVAGAWLARQNITLALRSDCMYRLRFGISVEALTSMFRFTILDVLWLMVVVGGLVDRVSVVGTPIALYLAIRASKQGFLQMASNTRSIGRRLNDDEWAAVLGLNPF
jgi:hypothetical protein